MILNLFSFASVAQDSAVFQKRPVFLQSAFLYDFPQSYGLTAGLSVPFASAIRQKIYRNHTFQKQKDYFISADAGFYRYPFNYTGVYFFPAAGVHVRKGVSQLYHEFAAGLGLLRTFYDGRVYEVDAAGNVNQRSLFGRFYATTHFSYTLGWQLQKTKPGNFDIRLKPSLWFQFPYNSFIKPHLSLEVGIRYHFRDVRLKTKVRIKQKIK